MNRNSIRIGLSFLIVAVAAGSARADSLLINGGFEDPLVVNTSCWELFNDLPGWDVSEGDDVKILNGWDAAEGDQWAEITDGSIYQTVNVEAGCSYALDFAYSPLPGVRDAKLKIKWAGATLDVLKTDGAALDDLDWIDARYIVTAESNQAGIEFSGLGHAGGVFLDNISLTSLTRVPEPAGIALLFIGAAALLRNRQ